MMEPVAYEVEAEKYGKEIVWPLYANTIKARLERGGYTVTLTPLVRLSDAEARIKELERERDEATGTLRYCEQQWAEERGTMIDKFVFERARAEAAEALLMEAGTPEDAARVLYDNWTGLDKLPSPARELAAQGHFFSALRLIFEPDADLRTPPKPAARAIHDKIGVKDE